MTGSNRHEGEAPPGAVHQRAAYQREADHGALHQGALDPGTLDSGTLDPGALRPGNPHQRSDPRIELVETDAGETTLLIDGGQAMQAWETDLMWRSADVLCGFGSIFLEVGLGLGISALRIANTPTTHRHVVVEKYGRVISLFRERHPDVPAALEIIEADILDHVATLEPDSLDGIFFDPYFPPEMLADEAMWARLVPAMRRALRPGGALVPFASTKPLLRWQFEPYFDRVILEKRRFRAYDATTYMTTNEGRAWIQAFIRTGTERQ